MFGLKSKQIQYRKRLSVISRNQRSLYKLVQGVLQCNYVVIPGCPAHRIIDVDDSQGRSSAINKGKKMVCGVYFDLVVIENDGFRPICAFRMDPNGHEQAESWDDATKELMKAAKSAELPVFVVPILQAYDTISIVARLRTIIPEECLSDKRLEEKLMKQSLAAQNSEMLAYQKDPWMEGGAGKIR